MAHFTFSGVKETTLRCVAFRCERFCTEIDVRDAATAAAAAAGVRTVVYVTYSAASVTTTN